MTESEALRFERLALVIGQFVGQTAELLNQIKRRKLSSNEIYESLFDINKASGLCLNELYFKGDTP